MISATNRRANIARVAMWVFVVLLTVGVLVVCLSSIGAAQETSTPTPENNTTETPTPAETPEDSSEAPDFVIEIVTSTDPSEASEEQLNTVREWFFSNGDSLTESEENRIGSWVSEASQSDSSGSNGSDSEVEDVPENVEANINDNLVLREYSFDEENGTVTLVLSADQFTQQVVLTDPQSAESDGVGDVRQKEVTVPSGETIETEFPVGFSAYTGSATVWVSAGAGDTIYVSNSAQELIDRLEWLMIPATALATAIAAALCALIVIYRKQRKLKNEYTNGPRNI